MVEEEEQEGAEEEKEVEEEGQEVEEEETQIKSEVGKAGGMEDDEQMPACC